MKKRIILTTKKALIEICEDKTIEYLKICDERVYQILNSIKNYEKRLFDSAINMITQSNSQ